jgi:hypothetical protein
MYLSWYWYVCVQAALSDYCGYMLLGEESLKALNQYLDSPVPMSNFRANIIAKRSPAFDEVCVCVEIQQTQLLSQLFLSVLIFAFQFSMQYL